jgi:hypothetical protein
VFGEGPGIYFEDEGIQCGYYVLVGGIEEIFSAITFVHLLQR